MYRRKRTWVKSKRTTTLNSSFDSSYSSQATVLSQPFLNSQSLRDFDDEEQLYLAGEEGEQLQISPQEEKKIQAILELSRKGKINLGNAFEIPVQVADPSLAETRSNRFWKFASELLSVSMGIYDKRVDCLFLGTHRMFDTMVRTSKHSQRQQSQHQDSNSLPILKMIPQEEVAGYDIASLNSQSPQKLNSKQFAINYIPDPLFSKKIQAFDSDSLSKVFFNAFETNQHLEISLFNHSSSQIVEQQKNELFTFSSREIEKCMLLSSSLFLAEGIGAFCRQIRKQGIVEDRNQSQHNWEEELGGIERRMEHQFSKNEDDTNFDKNEDFTNFSHFSEDLPQSPFNDDLSQGLFSQQSMTNTANIFLSSAPQHDNDFTPWDLEFKGMKLQKRKAKKSRGRKITKQRLSQAEIDINFSDGKIETRKDVLKVGWNNQFSMKSCSYSEKNVLPHNVAAHIRFVQYETREEFPQEPAFFPAPTQLQESPENMEIESIQEHIQQIPQIEVVSQFNSNSNQLYGNSQMSYLSQHSNPIGSVRQIKTRLCEQIRQSGGMKLSDLSRGLPVSSILVVILHLANQCKIVLQPTQGEDYFLRPL